MLPTELWLVWQLVANFDKDDSILVRVCTADSTLYQLNPTENSELSETGRRIADNLSDLAYEEWEESVIAAEVARDLEERYGDRDNTDYSD